MKSLRYIGLGDTTGYGVAAAALVRALDRAGHDVVWEPMTVGPGLALGYEPDPSGMAGPQDLWRLRADGRPCDDVILHLVPEYYPYFVTRERAAGAARIWGHTVWETDRLPAHWPALINRLDGVIVPTEWNRNIFRQCGVAIPIVVAPHLPQFSDAPASAADRASLVARLPDLAGRRVFYVVSTWLERKGLEPLVEAFTTAFNLRDPVALVIKTTPHDLERVGQSKNGEPLPVQPQLAAMIRRAILRQWRRPPPVLLLTDELTDGELRALHEIGDCFVSLCRAEGWGLGAFEAAWLGKPVIVTGWGGPGAFLTRETAHLVEFSLEPVKPAAANASYTPDQNWAQPDIASAVAALRLVFEQPEEAARLGARARDDLRSRYDAGQIVRELLDQIAQAGTGDTKMPDSPSLDPGDQKSGTSIESEPARKTGLAVRLLVRKDGRPRSLVRKALVMDKDGTPRSLTRRLLFDKNRKPRPIFANWYSRLDRFYDENGPVDYVDRMREVIASGRLRQARTLKIVTTRSTAFVGRALMTCLSDTPLACSLETRMPDRFTDDLYIVVDPRMFSRLPPAIRCIYVQTESGRRSQAYSQNYIALLARGLGVIDFSIDNIASLQKCGLVMRQTYFVPIHPVPLMRRKEDPLVRDIDIFFHGTINGRRQRYLNALADKFAIRIESNLLRADTDLLLRRSKVVVNVQLHDDSLLDTRLLAEALSHGARVVSESAPDQARHGAFDRIVEFVPGGELEAFLERVKATLESYDTTTNMAAIDIATSSFWGMRSMFLRALNGLGALSHEEFEAATTTLALPSNACVLCMPENLARLDFALSSLHLNAKMFPGLRNIDGWMGCAMSYKFLATRALADRHVPFTIYEDDAEFDDDAAGRIEVVRNHLDGLAEEWDIFSGLISDLSENANVLGVTEKCGERFISLDSVIGMVFGIYNRSALKLLSDFTIEGVEIMQHTIDRYLERQNIICITTERPLVRHCEMVGSTLWNLENRQLTQMIDKSLERLRQLAEGYSDLDKGVDDL